MLSLRDGLRTKNSLTFHNPNYFKVASVMLGHDRNSNDVFSN